MGFSQGPVHCLLALEVENTLFPMLRSVGWSGSRAAVRSPTQFCNAGWRGWSGGSSDWVGWKLVSVYQATALLAMGRGAEQERRPSREHAEDHKQNLNSVGLN